MSAAASAKRGRTPPGRRRAVLGERAGAPGLDAASARASGLRVRRGLHAGARPGQQVDQWLGVAREVAQHMAAASSRAAGWVRRARPSDEPGDGRPYSAVVATIEIIGEGERVERHGLRTVPAPCGARRVAVPVNGFRFCPGAPTVVPHDASTGIRLRRGWDRCAGAVLPTGGMTLTRRPRPAPTTQRLDKGTDDV